MEAKIRNATIKDFDILLDMMVSLAVYESKISRIKVADAKTKQFLKSNLKKWIKDKKYFLILAEIDARLVGYVFGWKEYVSEAYRNSYVGYICDCYVDEKYRGLSISTKLVGQIQKEFKKAGLKEAKLTVLKNNPAAKVWERMGFNEEYLEMRKLL